MTTRRLERVWVPLSPRELLVRSPLVPHLCSSAGCLKQRFSIAFLDEVSMSTRTRLLASVFCLAVISTLLGDTRKQRAVTLFAGAASQADRPDLIPAFEVSFKSPFGIAYDGLLRPGKSFHAVELDGGRVFSFSDGRPAALVGGRGQKGYEGDGHAPASAVFNGMHNVAVDGAKLYVADTWNHCVRLIELDKNQISTLAGTGEAGYAGDGGDARSSQFNYVMCVSLNHKKDKLYVADLRNRRIRVIDLRSGRVDTVAGNGQQGVPRDGARATAAPLVDPRAVTVDSDENVYVLERGGHALRVVRKDGTIHTVVGTGKPGFRDGPGRTAQLNSPKHVCMGSTLEQGDGQVFLADDQNRAIRQYDPSTGMVSTVLGRGHGDPEIKLNRPHGVMFTSGGLFVVDSGNHRILRVDMFDGVPRNVTLRGGFANSIRKFEQEKVGHVAFMGGSITAMNGYRPMVCEYLQQEHPTTKFKFTNAGISSTCSTTGAFRLQHDVLRHGPVDLFFIEFAVNDNQDAGHDARNCVLGMEGIIRQCLRHNPNMDIVITYFVNPPMLKELQENRLPLVMESHERVAEHYGITTVHLATEVADRIELGRLTWKEYGGTHPAEPGNRLCASMIHRLMHRLGHSQPQANSKLPGQRPTDETKFPAPLEEKSYQHGRFLPKDAVTLKNGFDRYVPDWNALPGNCRQEFLGRELTCATSVDSIATVQFEGSALGVYVLAGPDAGKIEASVDGGPFQTFDLYHRYSRGLHYPRTVMVARDLKSAKHVVELRVSREKHEASQGRAIRVLEFVAN